jgi:hypothetical protein
MNFLEAATNLLRSKGPRFSDIIAPEAIETVPLDSIAVVILRSIAAVNPGNALNRQSAIETYAGGYPRVQRARARQRISEAWQLLVSRIFDVCLLGHKKALWIQGFFTSLVSVNARLSH